MSPRLLSPLSFFFHAPATTEIYTLSLHDALPIDLDSTGTIIRIPAGGNSWIALDSLGSAFRAEVEKLQSGEKIEVRSEEHTSELQSQFHLVCRLLLEKKKKSHHNEPNNTMREHAP